MIKKTQWLAAALAAAMVLGLTACGSGEDQENTENESAAGTAGYLIEYVCLFVSCLA